MSRRKRSSVILDKAQRRIAGMKSIPALNLGSGLSIDTFSALITDAQQKLEAYNTVLSTVDQTYLDVQAAEQTLAEHSERMLLGVAVKYGKHSQEYVMAGGTQRKTTRRRTSQPDTQPVVTTAAAATAPSLNGNGKALVS